MKRVLKDENGFPLSYDPSKFYQEPERWFPIPPMMYNTPPGQYFVSTWGRVYNAKFNRYYPKQLIQDRNRYISSCFIDVYRNQVNYRMHQLIARMFVLPKPVIPGEIVIPNHIDGIKWHNEPYNLEWVTLSENTIHADQTDLIQRAYGEDNGHGALTDDQYREICQLTQAGYMPAEVNNIMNIGKDITNIVQKIRSGASESIIAKEYDFSNIPRKPYCRFSEEDVRFICLCLQDHPEMTYIEILDQLNNPGLKVRNLIDLKASIDNIKNRISYKSITKDYNF